MNKYSVEVGQWGIGGVFWEGVIFQGRLWEGMVFGFTRKGVINRAQRYVWRKEHRERKRERVDLC